LPTKVDIAIGHSIRKRRRALDMSQTVLAEKLGVTYQQVQIHERGRHRVRFSRLVDIAHALDWKIIDLLDDLDLDGEAGAGSQVRLDTRHLKRPGGAALIAAYAELPPALRKLVLNFVLGMVKEPGAAGPAAFVLASDRQAGGVTGPP
jgi:transcriptional regulator with XRE-family HTH domain